MTRLRPLRPDEAPQAAARWAVSFGGDPEEAVEVHRGRIDNGELYGLETDGGSVVGHCRLTNVGHWLGGRLVPTQHVAAVAVAPEHRGRGVAGAMMRAAVELGARGGAGLSLLFPATSLLYRRLGYEHAGTLSRHRLEARHAPLVGPPLRPAHGEPDWAAVRACHAAFAATLHGPGVRPGDRWEQLRAAAYHFVLEPEDAAGAIEAYLLYDHVPDPDDWRHQLAVRDWGAVTPRGLRALVGMVGRHRSVVTAATFPGVYPDLWAAFVDEQDVREVGGMWWMARGLDLPAAVAARGFPPGLSGAVTVAVDDPLLPGARGPWRLEVDDGRGRLSPATTARVRLDARAVGPLFTGFRSPRTLSLMGMAAGDPGALDWLGGAFASPAPVLLDFF